MQQMASPQMNGCPDLSTLGVFSGRPRNEPETAVRAFHANYSLRTGANRIWNIFFLNRKRHEPEPDLSLNPFLI